MSLKNPLTPAGIKPATFRFVAQHLNHCATAVPFRILCPDILQFWRSRSEIETFKNVKLSLSYGWLMCDKNVGEVYEVQRSVSFCALLRSLEHLLMTQTALSLTKLEGGV